jgi:hypothetical protein
MSSRYQSRMINVSQHEVARKELLANAGTTPRDTHTFLSGPARFANRFNIIEDLRKLYYKSRNMTCVLYADLEQYFATHLSIIDQVNSAITILQVFASRPGLEFPVPLNSTIYIDIRSHTLVRPELPSIDILPYIRTLLIMSHVRLHLVTWNDMQGRLLADLANSVIHQHALSWQELVLTSGNVEKLVVWWKVKSVDIVLRADSSWATDWDCGVEDGSVMELKTNLGLVAKGIGNWTGDVVVASIEGA